LNAPEIFRLLQIDGDFLLAAGLLPEPDHMRSGGSIAGRDGDLNSGIERQLTRGDDLSAALIHHDCGRALGEGLSGGIFAADGDGNSDDQPLARPGAGFC
jgi:hypothetical protein